MTSRLSAGPWIGRPESGSFVGLIVVYLFFAVMGGATFIGAPGLSSFLNMASEVGIIALAVGLLMIAGQLDLSVGYGSVLGIVLGTITFAIVSQGIYFTQIDRNWANLIIGITLLGAASKKKRAKA